MPEIWSVDTAPVALTTNVSAPIKVRTSTITVNVITPSGDPLENASVTASSNGAASYDLAPGVTAASAVFATTGQTGSNGAVALRALNSDAALQFRVTDGTTVAFYASGAVSGDRSTTLLFTLPGSVPDAPTNVTAAAGNGTATVSWTPAANPLPIKRSVITVVQTGQQVTLEGAGTSATVSGLPNGGPYTFTVRNVNALGASAPSAPSNAILMASAPSAPTGVSAAAGNGQATVSWTAADDGGSAVTGYVVTVV